MCNIARILLNWLKCPIAIIESLWGGWHPALRLVSVWITFTMSTWRLQIIRLMEVQKSTRLSLLIQDLNIVRFPQIYQLTSIPLWVDIGDILLSYLCFSFFWHRAHIFLVLNISDLMLKCHGPVVIILLCSVISNSIFTFRLVSTNTSSIDFYGHVLNWNFIT